MSLQSTVTDKIWSLQEAISGGAKLVLLWLARNVNQEGQALVSCPHIALSCGYNAPHVRKIILELRDQGLIEYPRSQGKPSFWVRLGKKLLGCLVPQPSKAEPVSSDTTIEPQKKKNVKSKKRFALTKEKAKALSLDPPGDWVEFLRACGEDLTTLHSSKAQRYKAIDAAWKPKQLKRDLLQRVALAENPTSYLISLFEFDQKGKAVPKSDVLEEIRPKVPDYKPLPPIERTPEEHAAGLAMFAKFNKMMEIDADGNDGKAAGPSPCNDRLSGAQGETPQPGGREGCIGHSAPGKQQRVSGNGADKTGGSLLSETLKDIMGDLLSG